MRGWAILLLLTLVPGAGAQSADDPNLRDAAGDQSPPGPATQWADIQRGWITEDAQGLRFTLQVAALTSTDTAQYEVVWFSNRDANITAAGLGASVEMGAAKGHRIESGVREACSSRQQPLLGRAPLAAAVHVGTPGRIVWELTADEFSAQRGDVFYGFCAFSYLRTPAQAIVAADTARTPGNSILNHSFQVGLHEAVRVGELQLRDAPPFVADEDEDGSPSFPSYDIDSFQLHFGEEWVDATLRLRSLDWSELDQRRWHLSLGIDRFDPYGSVSVGERMRATLFVRNETLRFATVDLEHHRDEDGSVEPWTLQVQPGSPGYVRVSFPGANWTLPRDLTGLSVFGYLSAFEKDEVGDQFLLYPESFFGAPLPWTLGLLGLAGALWFRRRQG